MFLLSVRGLFSFSGGFPLITGTGGRARATVDSDGEMKWKSVCLIVLKMRLNPCRRREAGPPLQRKAVSIRLQNVHLERCLAHEHLTVNE